jgi:hypothetical protein
MLAESGTRVVAPAAALADAGVGAAAQPEREQVRDEVRRTVQEAMEAAREGAANAAQGSREAGRLEAELARARDAVRQAQGQGGVSILRDESGRVVVNTADGRTIVIDPRAVASEEARRTGCSRSSGSSSAA